MSIVRGLRFSFTSRCVDALSVVIPCHNEEMNIGPLVMGLRDLYGEYIHEIIPVDDNSTDGTASVIRKLAEEDTRIKPVFRIAAEWSRPRHR